MPLFSVAIAFALGVCAALTQMWFLVLLKPRWIFLILLGAFEASVLAPALPKEEFRSDVYFQVSRIEKNVRFNRLQYRYHGKANGIPSILSVRGEKISGDRDWVIGNAKVYPLSSHKAWVTADARSSIQPVEGSFSWAKRRSEWKKALAERIAPYYPDKRVKQFVCALLTGEVEHPRLAHELGRVGVRHLLAISGLHFATLIGVLSLLLSPLKRKGIPLLLVAISVYVFFLGDAPSIQRTYIGLIVYLVGRLFRIQIAPIDAWSVALLSSLIADPRALLEVGFQLSFGATAAIFLLYTPAERALTRFFPARPYSEVVQMPLVDQWGSIGVGGMRQALALCGAINLVMIPLSLFHFGSFPLLGLFYNLFIPPLVMVGFVLAVGGLVLPYLHIGAFFIFREVLEWVVYAPRSFDFVISSGG